MITKRLFTIFLCAVIILLFISCDNLKDIEGVPDNNAEVTSNSTDTTTVPTIEPILNIPSTCSKIELVYCNNYQKALTIEDDEICSDLIQFILNANGVYEGSSKGRSGVPFALTVYFEEGSPLEFFLWSDSSYSITNYKDKQGYPYLFSDDLSDMFNYLAEKYPSEFWYPDNATD